MGMFAGMFVCSFRMGSEHSSSRTALQVNSLRILIPSLLPSFSGSTGVHIDYGAHIGGAMGGIALALVLLPLWPKTALIPQARRAAVIVAMVGLILFAGSAAFVADNYAQYETALTAPAKLPATKLPATTNTPTDGRASDLRGNNPAGSQPGPLAKCRAIFPTGVGAIPGINCAN